MVTSSLPTEANDLEGGFEAAPQQVRAHAHRRLEGKDIKKQVVHAV